MASSLDETPCANRVHVAFFGLRNAGKSTLVNAFTGQSLAIVSDVPGTTTDPVSKAMEILPLGPCLITDTAGLDDAGALGAERVAKTLKVLETTDVAVWVSGSREERTDKTEEVWKDKFLSVCQKRNVVVLDFKRGDSVEELKERIAALKLKETLPDLLEGLIQSGDRVVCVCPIDESAPKGRLILPQVQVIRACLDRHLACTVCQPDELSDCLNSEQFGSKGRFLVVTDSQAFAAVNHTIRKIQSNTQTRKHSNNPEISLTSFSILFARQKGDLEAFRQGLRAVSSLRDGARVLVAEGCTHHRQCNDIGSVKIPKALSKLAGGVWLDVSFASGNGFPEDLSSYALVVHCGGCMLTRREMLRRMACCRAAGVPIVNFGILLSAAQGVPIDETAP